MGRGGRPDDGRDFRGDFNNANDVFYNRGRGGGYGGMTRESRFTLNLEITFFQILK